MIRSDGFGGFASDIRTYGYPAFLAVLMVVVGDDLVDLQAAVFVVQLAFLLGAAWLGARRVAGALGMDGLEPWIFAATAANPLLLLSTVQVLTDLIGAMLIYLAIAMSLPQRQAESTARVAALAACACFCAGLAVMVRPASLIVAPVVAVIWIARAGLFRDVRWIVVPLGVCAFALPFVPQAWTNQRAFGVTHPLLVRSLYNDTLRTGLRYAKTASLAVPGAPSALLYENPLRPTPDLPLGQIVVDEPGRLLATLLIHAFALLDQDFPFAYIRDFDPWYRWPISLMGHLFVLGAMFGLVVGLRTRATTSGSVLRQRRFALLALGTAAVAVIAVYLPMDIQVRYALPLYPLLAAPFAIGVGEAARVARSASLARIAPGVLVVAVWLGGTAALSVWLQAQAPMLVALREGSIGPRAIARRDAKPAAQPTPIPGPTVPPPREIPVAKYVTDLPRELVAKRSTELDVTVTNAGHETWNVRGEYPVNVAARFVAQTTELHERVKGLMRASQSVELPRDLAPGESATVRLRIMAPPEPGRYTLLVHVTRLGVPDSKTTTDRVVRVVDGR